MSRLNVRTPVAAGLSCLAVAVGAPSMAATVTLAPAGFGQPVETAQPSLGLTALVQVTGVANDLGRIRWFAGDFEIGGFAAADGRLLDIASNVELYSRLRTTYGGDGVTTFALPDLRGRAVIGAGATYSLGTAVGAEYVTLTIGNLPSHSHSTATGPSSATGSGLPYNNMQPSLALRYDIVAEDALGGLLDAPGFVTIDASTFGDRTTRPANGEVLATGDFTQLSGVIGLTYGGTGTTFALPDADGRLIVGAGTGPGLSTRTLGGKQGTATETLSLAEMPLHDHADPDTLTQTGAAGGSMPENNVQPELALRYVIATQGYFPPRDGEFGALSDLPYLGEVAIFAGNAAEAPRGWAFAEGQLLPISSNSALFAILRTQFGGDGRRNFALPDLRGRTPVGAGFGSPWVVGESWGVDRLNLTNFNLPPHTHSVERIDPSVIPLPASAGFLLAGLAAFGFARRRRAV